MSEFAFPDLPNRDAVAKPLKLPGGRCGPTMSCRAGPAVLVVLVASAGTAACSFYCTCSAVLSYPLMQLGPPLTARSTVSGTSKDEVEAGPQPVHLEQAIVPPDFQRQKIPLEKGFSQMSWMQLSQKGKDINGAPMNGQPMGRRRREPVTMDEVKTHNTMEDGWTVINGVVYNVTPYLRFHPGGANILKVTMGKDGTNMFNRYHRWVNIQALMEKCVVGVLEKPE